MDATSTRKRKHHQLLVWQRAMELAKDVYRITESFPAKETYVLASQMRRAAISVPSNSAEGAARSRVKEYLNFLLIARGSLVELETQVILAKELGFIRNDEQLLNKLEAIFALINGLIRSLRSRRMD